MYKIYKIIDNTNSNVYIGQTRRTLKVRLAEHKNSQKCRSRDIIKNGDYRIELIEETDDKSRERWWIEDTDCVNISTPGRTNKEYYQNNKDKIKEYNKDNKEKKKDYNKEYREKNKEKQKEYDKPRYIWFSSMGGSPWHNNMSLLKIDPNLFN